MAREQNPWDDDQLQQRAMAQQFGIEAPAEKMPPPQMPSDAPRVSAQPVSAPPGLWEGPDGNHKDVQTVEDRPSPVQASVFQGFKPQHAMEGFDFNREQNTGKSAKDAFAYLANQAPPPPLNDKAALGAWFTQYIKPGMDALGHKINSVEGDKFNFENWQGKFDVDYGRGAGADGGALAWQVDDGSAVPGTGTYQPPTGIGATQPLVSDQDNAMTRILAEIEALKSGGASPMQQDALARMFEV